MIYSGTFNINSSLKRRHIYEGYTEKEIAEDIKKNVALYEPDKLITISAVGALNPRLKVGELVLITDIITLFYQSTFKGASFVDLSNPFDNDLLDKIKYEYPLINKVTHVFMRGPHYESWADKEALRLLGADTVGMSTIPEVIIANRIGLPVVSFGIITNMSFVKHNHAEVQKAVESIKKPVQDILEKIDGF